MATPPSEHAELGELGGSSTPPDEPSTSNENVENSAMPSTPNNHVFSTPTTSRTFHYGEVPCTPIQLNSSSRGVQDDLFESPSVPPIKIDFDTVDDDDDDGDEHPLEDIRSKHNQSTDGPYGILKPNTMNKANMTDVPPACSTPRQERVPKKKALIRPKFTESGSELFTFKKKKIATNISVQEGDRIPNMPKLAKTAPAESRIQSRTRKQPGNNSIHDFRPELQDSFTMIEKLGNGSFGTVHKVQKSETKEIYAMKVPNDTCRSEYNKRKQLREVDALKKVRNHPHIIQYNDHWISREFLHILTEICDFSLEHYLADKLKLTQGLAENFLVDILKGLGHVHSLGLIHMDVKPANILIKNGILKLGDFGCCVPVNVLRDPQDGDSRYLSPEGLYDIYRQCGDVFSVGIIGYEMVTGIDAPGRGKGNEALRQNDLPKCAPKIWKDISCELKNLIAWMTIKDFPRRPTIRQLFDYDYIKKIAADRDTQLPKDVVKEGTKFLEKVPRDQHLWYNRLPLDQDVNFNGLPPMAFIDEDKENEVSSGAKARGAAEVSLVMEICDAPPISTPPADRSYKINRPSRRSKGSTESGSRKDDEESDDDDDFFLPPPVWGCSDEEGEDLNRNSSHIGNLNYSMAGNAEDEAEDNIKFAYESSPNLRVHRRKNKKPSTDQDLAANPPASPNCYAASKQKCVYLSDTAEMEETKDLSTSFSDLQIIHGVGNGFTEPEDSDSAPSDEHKICKSLSKLGRSKSVSGDSFLRKRAMPVKRKQINSTPTKAGRVTRRSDRTKSISQSPTPKAQAVSSDCYPETPCRRLVDFDLTQSPSSRNVSSPENTVKAHLDFSGLSPTTLADVPVNSEQNNDGKFGAVPDTEDVNGVGCSQDHDVDMATPGNEEDLLESRSCESIEIARSSEKRDNVADSEMDIEITDDGTGLQVSIEYLTLDDSIIEIPDSTTEEGSSDESAAIADESVPEVEVLDDIADVRSKHEQSDYYKRGAELDSVPRDPKPDLKVLKIIDKETYTSLEQTKSVLIANLLNELKICGYREDREDLMDMILANCPESALAELYTDRSMVMMASRWANNTFDLDNIAGHWIRPDGYLLPESLPWHQQLADMVRANEQEIKKRMYKLLKDILIAYGVPPPVWDRLEERHNGNN